LGFPALTAMVVVLSFAGEDAWCVPPAPSADGPTTTSAATAPTASSASVVIRVFLTMKPPLSRVGRPRRHDRANVTAMPRRRIIGWVLRLSSQETVGLP